MFKVFRFFRRGYRSVDMNETEGEKGLNCLIFDYLSLVFVMFVFSIFPMPNVYGIKPMFVTTVYSKKYIFRLLTLFLLGEPSAYQAGFYLVGNVETFKISLRIPKSH